MEIKKSAYAQGYSERIDSFAPARFDLSACPSMSLAAPRLHSRAGHSTFVFLRNAETLKSGKLKRGNQSQRVTKKQASPIVIRSSRSPI